MRWLIKLTMPITRWNGEEIETVFNEGTMLFAEPIGHTPIPIFEWREASDEEVLRYLSTTIVTDFYGNKVDIMPDLKKSLGSDVHVGTRYEYGTNVIIRYGGKIIAILSKEQYTRNIPLEG